jgi:glucose-1-phosphate cytidylyltransferase
MGPDAPPKALTPVGGRAIIELIMQRFAECGFRNFVIALGQRGAEIERHLSQCATDLDIVCEHTGETTQPAGRLKRVSHHLDDETFLMAWCDGLSDIDFADAVRFHASHGRAATVVAAHPHSSLGVLDLEGDAVRRFREKPRLASIWINAGYFVLEPAVIGEIAGDETEWEGGTLVDLLNSGELMAYRHDGYWRCMDTTRDAADLNLLAASGDAPWQRTG